MNAETFNALYEVGVPVFAYPGARPEVDSKCTRLVTRTRSRASVLGGHTDVVWVDGHSACIALTHVDVITEGQYRDAVVATQGALPIPAGPVPQRDVEDELAGARLALFEEEQDNARLRLALASAQRGRRELRGATSSPREVGSGGAGRASTPSRSGTSCGLGWPSWRR